MNQAARGRVFGALALLTLLVTNACGAAAEPPSRTLRVLMTDDWVTAPFLDAVRGFERTHRGVHIDIERGPIGKMADAVRAGISSGAPPDVVQGHAFSAAGQDLAEQIDDLWSRRLTPGEFLPGAVEDVTWAGHRYGVPLDTNAMAVLYNVDHFKQARLAPPGPDTTFAEFEALAKALTSTDGGRRGLAVSLSTWATYGWVRANGGELALVGDDGQGRFGFDSAPTVETVAYLAKLVSEGVAFGPVPVDNRSADAYALFRSGQASMHTSGSWDLVRVRKEAPDGRWGVALMPRGSGGTAGTAAGGSSLWIPKGSAQRELAFEFMLQVTSDRYALRFAAEEGRLPVRPRLFSDATFSDPDIGVFLRQLPTAHQPLLGAFYEASKAFEQALRAVLVDGEQAGAALRAAQSRAGAAAGPS